MLYSATGTGAPINWTERRLFSAGNSQNAASASFALTKGPAQYEAGGAVIPERAAFPATTSGPWLYLSIKTALNLYTRMLMGIGT